MTMGAASTPSRSRGASLARAGVRTQKRCPSTVASSAAWTATTSEFVSASTQRGSSKNARYHCHDQSDQLIAKLRRGSEADRQDHQGRQREPDPDERQKTTRGQRRALTGVLRRPPGPARHVAHSGRQQEHDTEGEHQQHHAQGRGGCVVAQLGHVGVVELGQSALREEPNSCGVMKKPSERINTSTAATATPGSDSGR